MINSLPIQAFGLIVALLFPFIAGCREIGRPPLSTVHGRVTLDGKPLVHTSVVFHPASGVRESGGTTDENGDYQLKYIGDVLGGVVGANTVQITKQLTPDPSSQIVPARYNKNSTLVSDVNAGDNTIDFDLISARTP
ncbi:MAG: carboxypeptidase regulatory-like domain-containing protein [Planctomycetota bacterium]